MEGGLQMALKEMWPSASEAIGTKDYYHTRQTLQSKLLELAFPFVWPSETDQAYNYISDATMQSKYKKWETLNISQLGQMTIFLKALHSKTPRASVPKQSISVF